MIALARSSCKRATASSPRVASSDCDSARNSPSSAGAVTAVGWSSAVARRAHPPILLITREPRRMSPPCSPNRCVFVCIASSSSKGVVSPARRNNTTVNPRSTRTRGVSPPLPAAASGLLDQVHALNLHRPIRGLHHVVYGEQSHRHGGKCFHLH